LVKNVCIYVIEIYYINANLCWRKAFENFKHILKQKAQVNLSDILREADYECF